MEYAASQRSYWTGLRRLGTAEYAAAPARKISPAGAMAGPARPRAVSPNRMGAGSRPTAAVPNAPARLRSAPTPGRPEPAPCRRDQCEDAAGGQGGDERGGPAGHLLVRRASAAAMDVTEQAVRAGRGVRPEPVGTSTARTRRPSAAPGCGSPASHLPQPRHVDVAAPAWSPARPYAVTRRSARTPRARAGSRRSHPGSVTPPRRVSADIVMQQTHTPTAFVLVKCLFGPSTGPYGGRVHVLGILVRAITFGASFEVRP